MENVIKRAIYFKLEYNCHTKITDEELLKNRIDFALKNNDKASFLQLSQQLKEVLEYGK